MPFWNSLLKPNVTRMEAKKDIAGLIKAVSYKGDAKVRRYALDALVRIGDARAVELLAIALKGEDAENRRYAISKLKQIGDARVVEPLIAGLKDRDVTIRKDVVNVLGQLADAQTVESLVKALLKDEDREVRQMIAEILAEMDDTHFNDSQRATIAIYRAISQGAWEKTRKFGDVAVDPLIDALKNTDLFKSYLGKEDMRAYKLAAATLAQIGGIRAMDFLSTALNDEYWLVSEAAAVALKQTGNVHTVELFTAQLENPETRAKAAEWLGQTQDARAVDPLVTRLQQDWGAAKLSISRMSADALRSHYARFNGLKATIKALGQIGDKRAIAPLIKILQDQEVSDEIRRDAAGGARPNWGC